jgi:hypothetical protein
VWNAVERYKREWETSRCLSERWNRIVYSALKPDMCFRLYETVGGRDRKDHSRHLRKEALLVSGMMRKSVVESADLIKGVRAVTN